MHKKNVSKFNSDLVIFLTKLANGSTSFGLFFGLYLTWPFTSCFALLQYWIFGNSIFVLCCLSCWCLCSSWSPCLECPCSLHLGNSFQSFKTPLESNLFQEAFLISTHASNCVKKNPLSNSIVNSVCILWICHFILQLLVFVIEWKHYTLYIYF